MKDIFCVYLTKEECQQIIAIWEKQGILGNVVMGIRAAEATKGIK